MTSFIVTLDSQTEMALSSTASAAALAALAASESSTLTTLIVVTMAVNLIWLIVDDVLKSCE
jgi:hypothetical protein